MKPPSTSASAADNITSEKIMTPSEIALANFPEDDGPEVPLVGANIRRLRKERGISLAELSELSGVSAGMLSQIERDTANPSLKVLTRIRFALDVPLSALFEEDEEGETAGDPNFVRRGDHRPLLDFGHDRMVKELLSPSIARNLEVMILHIPPGGNSGNQPLHFVAEKAGVVLTGELWLRIGDQTVRLKEGDSFQFDSNQDHSFGNDTTSPCSVIWIIAQPVAERHL